MEVKIVGSGVIGLTAGVCLNIAGHETEIIAEDVPMESNDYKNKEGIATEYATASVKPSTIPNKNLQGMLVDSIDIFDKIVEETDMVELVPHFMGGENFSHPEYRNILHNYEEMEESEYNFPFDSEEGAVFDVHYVHMDKYIKYLIGLYEETGGLIRKTKVSSVDNLKADYVFNCSGYGSRELFGDESLKPVRGHLAYVETDFQISSDKYGGAFSYSYTFNDKKVYCYPHRDMIIIGKTAIHDSSEWEDYSDSDYYKTDRGEDVPKHIINKNKEIIERASDLDIENYSIFGTSGYRPYREEGIRVDEEDDVIHNYGHGGSGVTFSWGSALEAVSFINQKEEVKGNILRKIENHETLF